MKIKKIDIQAFRLFGNETVDFTTKCDTATPANFVALYAPNGFGKTSFFDAMEFCMTGKIHRLDGSLSEDVGEDKKQTGNKSFIHNKDLPDQNVLVRMEFDDREPMQRVCNPDEEYQLLEGVPDNTYFSEAILAQDFFSSFISNKDAKQRFEIFTKRFSETNDLLDYRQWLKTEIISLSKQISATSRIIQEKSALIDTKLAEIDIKKLSKDIIEGLKLLGYDVDLDKELSQNIINEYKLQSSVWMEDCEKIVEKQNLLLSKLVDLKTGTANLISIYELPNLENQINEAQTQSSMLQKQLADISQYKEVLALVESTNKSIKSHEQTVNTLHYLAEHYEEYFNGKNKIHDFETKIVREKEIIETLQKNKVEASDKLNTILVQKHKVQESLLIQKESLSGLSQRYAAMQAIQTTIQDTTQALALAQSQFEGNNAEIEGRKALLAKHHDLLRLLSQQQIDLSEGLYFNERKSIVEISVQIETLRNALRELDASIEDKSKYLDEIGQLVSNSRVMLSKLPGGVCPLCGFDYNTQEALLQSISSNTIINSSLEKDLQSKQAIEAEITEKTADREKLNSELVAIVEAQTRQIQTELTGLIDVANQLSKKIQELSLCNEENSRILQGKYADISSISEDGKRHLLNAQISQYEAVLQQHEIEESKIQESIATLDAQITEANRHIDFSAKEIVTIKTTQLYIFYLNYMEANDMTEIIKDEILTKINACNSVLNNQRAALIEYSQQLSELKVVPDLEDSIVANKQRVEKSKNENSVKISRLKSYLETECGIANLQYSDAGDVVKEFEEVVQRHEKQIETTLCKKELLSKFLSVLELIEKTYVNQQIQNEIQELHNTEKTKSNYQKECKAEVEEVETYLKEFVQEYFELDLINQLYNTIDPHPDYKEVRFDCNFRLKNPRLNVLLNNVDEGKESIVPNLYFSTAQINILSLCIFLAKALTAKDDDGKSMDCIFIDDPIQAMDDINILSVIDLLRNIAFSMNKQIVITTHDRNFYELLKKKVPEDLFNARYITFKERGKILA